MFYKILRFIMNIVFWVGLIPLLGIYYIGEFIEKIFKKNKEVE